MQLKPYITYNLIHKWEYNIDNRLGSLTDIEDQARQTEGQQSPTLRRSRPAAGLVWCNEWDYLVVPVAGTHDTLQVVGHDLLLEFLDPRLHINWIQTGVSPLL